MTTAAPAASGHAIRTLVPRPAVPGGPYLVAGLGRAGQAAAAALAGLAAPGDVTAWDAEVTRTTRAARRQLEAARVRVKLGPAPSPAAFRTLVKSPGIPCDSALIRRARRAGIEVIDELELGWRMSAAPAVAITGTNGKSTVSALVVALLAASGREVPLAGNTEFGSPLSAAAREPSDWLVCEASSFQLEACPALLPEIAVLTNITREHLSRHGTMLAYASAKRRLFIRRDGVVPLSVVGVFDRFGETLADEVERAGGRVVRVGDSPEADYRVVDATWDLRTAQLRLATPREELVLESRLPGMHGARNVATALAVADALGVERSIAVDAIAREAGPPGRFEHVDAGQRFAAIVDFAHTVDALDHLLCAVRSGVGTGGRVLTVLGLAGATEPPARRAMGAVVRALSDEAILTTSGYKGQPRMTALADFLEGARGVSGGPLRIVLDRRRAIEQAVSSAHDGDAVVIPGRGAFTEITVDSRGGTIPFDDRVVTRELLGELA